MVASAEAVGTDLRRAVDPIHTTPPAVTAIQLDTATINNANAVIDDGITVTFWEAVTGFDAADLMLADGVHADTPISNDGGVTWTATLTADAGTVANNATVSVGTTDPWTDG